MVEQWVVVRWMMAAAGRREEVVPQAHRMMGWLRRLLLAERVSRSSRWCHRAVVRLLAGRHAYWNKAGWRLSVVRMVVLHAGRLLGLLLANRLPTGQDFIRLAVVVVVIVGRLLVMHLLLETLQVP